MVSLASEGGVTTLIRDALSKQRKLGTFHFALNSRRIKVLKRDLRIHSNEGDFSEQFYKF